MTRSDDVTLVENAIHNPHEPRHFMRIVPAGTRRTASLEGTLVADSVDAVVVKEVGRDVYDPVVYFPRSDVEMDLLTRVDKTTHCPLKGDTEYFDVQLAERTASDAAWSYVHMIDVEGVDQLRGMIAFDSRLIDVA